MPVVDGVGVLVARSVGVAVRVGESVSIAVRVIVAVAVGDCVPVRDCVGVGLGLTVGVTDGLDDAVAVGLGGTVGVTVLLGVNVRVGARVAVDVGCGVCVLVGIGWLPMWTMRCACGPRVPSASRTWIATSVSPSPKAFAAATTRQNCVALGADDTNVGAPNASTVHALREAVATVNAHAKSLSPLVTP